MKPFENLQEVIAAYEKIPKEYDAMKAFVDRITSLELLAEFSEWAMKRRAQLTGEPVKKPLSN